MYAEIEQLKLKVEILEEENKNLKNQLEDQNLQLKYALFDAEASKRENAYLRKLIDDNKK